jgi:hypothetical protein
MYHFKPFVTNIMTRVRRSSARFHIGSPRLQEVTDTALTFQSLVGTLRSTWFKTDKFYTAQTLLLCVSYGSEIKQ